MMPIASRWAQPQRIGSGEARVYFNLQGSEYRTPSRTSLTFDIGRNWRRCCHAILGRSLLPCHPQIFTYITVSARIPAPSPSLLLAERYDWLFYPSCRARSYQVPSQMDDPLDIDIEWQDTSVAPIDDTLRVSHEWENRVVFAMRSLLDFFHSGCIICFIETNDEWRSHTSEKCETDTLCGCNHTFDRFRRALRAPVGVCFGCWVDLVRRCGFRSRIAIHLSCSDILITPARSDLLVRTMVLPCAWSLCMSSPRSSFLRVPSSQKDSSPGQRGHLSVGWHSPQRSATPIIGGIQIKSDTTCGCSSNGYPEFSALGLLSTSD